MSADSKMPAGLRERKKERTRRTIRTEAMRLFKRQGYAETTIEQIAAAADISPSTFFRYFPSKEQLALADDMDPIMIRAIEDQPADLLPLTAFRKAMREAFAEMDPEDWAFEQDRMRLISREPELRAVIAQETERNLVMVAELIAARVGRDPDDDEVRAFSGALIGATLTAWGDDGLDVDKVDRILGFMEAGMPMFATADPRTAPR